MLKTFGSLKTGTTFILEFDGCCYTKIGFFALRPHKANTYSIPDDARVTVICDCLTHKGESL